MSISPDPAATSKQPRREHRVEWRLTQSWGVVGRVFCEADPLDGRCYNYCPIAECEDGCVAPDEHEQMVNPTCNVKDWLESDELGAFYQGEEVPPRDDYIKVWWDRSGIAWDYAASPSSTTESGE